MATAARRRETRDRFASLMTRGGPAFVTLDGRFLKRRREPASPCRDIYILRPRELQAKLSTKDRAE